MDKFTQTHETRHTRSRGPLGPADTHARYNSGGRHPINQLALRVVVGLSATSFLWRLRRRMRVDFAGLAGSQMRISLCLLTIPLLLLAFQATVLPRAASWSRDRAIQRSPALIAEIESFRQRRGHYPVSLRSLNRDVPTGIVGIERFHYAPSGEAYHVCFVRPSLELDAALGLNLVRLSSNGSWVATPPRLERTRHGPRGCRRFRHRATVPRKNRSSPKNRAGTGSVTLRASNPPLTHASQSVRLALASSV